MLPIQLNGHVVGIFLKEMVRRAIIAIRNERLIFTATVKEGYSGKMDDVFTTADTKAQEVMTRSIVECLPGVGIIAEENLSIHCRIKENDAYVTIDPLDGTRAFVRRQSHGVATMIALVINGEVVSAYVGDVNTQEIYGYRPNSKNVHRIYEYELTEKLSDIKRSTDISEQAILSNQEIPDHGGIRTAISHFKQYLVDGGSIGALFARLWKGEIGGLLLHPSKVTPWDETPVMGISKKLGFVFLEYHDNGWVEIEYVPRKEMFERDTYMLIIHARIAWNF